jgi:hypothetical protein
MCSLSCRIVDSLVVVVSRPLAGCKRNRGSVPSRLRGFTVPETSNTETEPNHLPFQHTLEAIFVDIKRPEREVDHSCVSSTDVINVW